MLVCGQGSGNPRRERQSGALSETQNYRVDASRSSSPRKRRGEAMGLRESDGSIRYMNAMIARLRKATSAWTSRFSPSYSELRTSSLAGSSRDQPAELADAESAMEAP